MVAGPYTSGARTAADREANLRELSAASLVLFRLGYLPVVGVHHVLPLLEVAGPESFDGLMMPISLALAERCEAVVHIGGESVGADLEVEKVRAAGGAVFEALEDVPAASRRMRPKGRGGSMRPSHD